MRAILQTAVLAATFCFVFLRADVRGADVVQFRSGAKATGTIKKVDDDARKVVIEVKLGSRKYSRTYDFDRIKSITQDGKTRTLGEPTPTAGKKTGALRSRAEIDELINSQGRTPPEWYDSTELDYPKTLDLSWPLKPPTKGWDNQKNMGQYIWDVINPNPRRWQSGAKLVHHIMSQHRNDRALLQRDMQALGGMYFRLFQDYARAAFWFRQAGTTKGTPQATKLAECYWKLGNKRMALDMLDNRLLPMNAIKLLGDMGETERALRLANAFGKRDNAKHQAFLLAGDACRLAGRDAQAVEYYNRVIAAGNARNEDYQKRFVGRARDSIAAIELDQKVDVSKVADGTYQASAVAYNGSLNIEVKIADGKITGLRVTKHQEKQFYAAIDETPRQIIAKQSVRRIDATSGATITSQAIVNATAQALAKGATSK